MSKWILYREGNCYSLIISTPEVFISNYRCKSGYDFSHDVGFVSGHNYSDYVSDCIDNLKYDLDYLKDYDIKNNNCTIKAGTSGYFYTNKEISNGTYIQEGDSIGQIYPKEQSGYFAQVYVENSDIAKIKPDQEVKFEMASYPSSEYGYFTGTVKEIAKDVTVDQNTGNAYYIVKVECKNMEIKNKEGEKGNLKSGMAAQAKIVVDDDSVLHFVLSKINLVD